MKRKAFEKENLTRDGKEFHRARKKKEEGERFSPPPYAYMRARREGEEREGGEMLISSGQKFSIARDPLYSFSFFSSFFLINF